jgi:hypothetical protein
VEVRADDAPSRGPSSKTRPRVQFEFLEWVDPAIAVAAEFKRLSGLKEISVGSGLGVAAAFSSLHSGLFEGAVLPGSAACPCSPGRPAMGPCHAPEVKMFAKMLGRSLRFDIISSIDFEKDYGFAGAGDQQAASGLSRNDAPHKGEISLADGTRYSGLIIPAIDAGIAASPADGLPGIQGKPSGQLGVDAWLRPSSLRSVFAISDLAATGEGMTIVSTMRQTPSLAKTRSKMAGGKPLEDLSAYKVWWAPPILVPLGPDLGASALPLGSGWVVGDRTTSMIKGRALFIPRYHKEFGRS